MAETKSLRKNSFFSFFNAFTTLLFPLITFPYASRILHPEGIGKNNFAVSIEGYFAMLAGLGISAYATREAAKLRDNKYEFSKFCKEIISINLISMIISYTLLLILLFTVPKFEQYRLLILVRSMDIFFCTIGLEWLYRAEEDFKYITLRSFFFKIAGLIFLFIFVRDQDDIVEYTFFGILTSVASNICNLFHSKKYIDYKIKCKLELTRHFKFIFTFFGMVVITSLYTILDTSLLGFLSDDFQVGLYTAATKLNKISLTLITSLTAVLLPRLSYFARNNEKEKIIELAQKSASIIILLALPVIAGLIFLAKPLTLIFSGPEYLQAIPAMYIISPIVLFISLSSLIGSQIFAAINKEKLTLISTSIAAIINITLNFIFIPKYGAMGAAIGTVFAEFGVTLFQIMCVREYINKSIIFTFFQSIIGCVLISFEIFFISKYINNNILIIITSILISVISYGTVLYLFHNKYFIESISIVKDKLLKKTK